MKRIILLLLVSLSALGAQARPMPPVAPRIDPIRVKAGAFFFRQLPPFTIPGLTQGVTHEMRYELTNLPQGLSFIPATRQLLGFAPASGGAFKIHYRVTDETANQYNRTDFSLVVESNLAPITPEYASQYVEDNVPFSVQLPTFIDPENESISYQLKYYGSTSSDELPYNLHYDVNTRHLSGVCYSGESFEFGYIATDASGNKSYLYFWLLVKPKNQPVAPLVNELTLPIDKPVMLALPAFTHPTNGFLTYSVQNLPAGLGFLTASRVLYGTPTKLGSTPVYYSARNSQGVTESVRFRITVVANASQSTNSSARLAAEPVEQKPEWTAIVLGNPVCQDPFEVELKQAQGRSLRFQLVDSSGRPVSEQWQSIQQETERVQVRMSHQLPGVYLLRIAGDGQTKTLKVIR